MYEEEIQNRIRRLGFARSVHPKQVEELMRVQFGTLDHLSAAEFRREADGCILEIGYASESQLREAGVDLKTLGVTL